MFYNNNTDMTIGLIHAAAATAAAAIVAGCLRV
jgi:hypothetical protein